MTVPRKRRGTPDIMREENIHYLEGKIKHALILLPNDESIEKKTIEYIVAELVEHGKDENQIYQIALMSRLMAQELGFDSSYCERLEKAAQMYDIGNIVIADEIYAKDEALSFEEFTIVKNHTLIGEAFLATFEYDSITLAALLSAQHHEWWNGSGYPRQLKSVEIDIAARIVSLADVVGALFTRRPGRKNWDYVEILNYMETRKGLQFDPEVVNAFMRQKAKMYHVLTSKFGDYIV
jgi:putative two-component system response regulator